ncbi:4137_t:CDS:10 [Ambispora leptoticha]|uniref:4137_t:CDS:1 n=1 Tax=Ambispora leptoticha TaxID=144679 RepID=A0A9N8W0H4_9GLOM|nr:4137_t:CDS:10 [Ambispora leptoticha]
MPSTLESIFARINRFQALASIEDSSDDEVLHAFNIDPLPKPYRSLRVLSKNHLFEEAPKKAATETKTRWRMAKSLHRKGGNAQLLPNAPNPALIHCIGHWQGINSGIKGHSRRGIKQIRAQHRIYGNVAITNKYDSSKTCPFCFSSHSPSCSKECWWKGSSRPFAWSRRMRASPVPRKEDKLHHKRKRYKRGGEHCAFRGLRQTLVRPSTPSSISPQCQSQKVQPFKRTPFSRDTSIGLPAISFEMNKYDIEIRTTEAHTHACKDRAPSSPDQDGIEMKKTTRAPRYCRTCKNYKPPRSHHCKTCKRCVLKMDHHCPWTNNCVGHYNYGHFIRFIFWVDVACIFHFTLLIKSTIHIIEEASYIRYDDTEAEPSITKTILIVLNFVACLPVLFGVGPLSIYHFYCMCSNTTTIESWEKEKVATMVRRGKIKEIKYPYDIGLLANIKSILGDNPILWCMPQSIIQGGLSYPIAKDADKTRIWPPKDPDNKPSATILPKPWDIYNPQHLQQQSNTTSHHYYNQRRHYNNNRQQRSSNEREGKRGRSGGYVIRDISSEEQYIGVGRDDNDNINNRNSQSISQQQQQRRVPRYSSHSYKNYSSRNNVNRFQRTNYNNNWKTQTPSFNNNHYDSNNEDDDDIPIGMMIAQKQLQAMNTNSIAQPTKTASSSLPPKSIVSEITSSLIGEKRETIRSAETKEVYCTATYGRKVKKFQWTVTRGQITLSALKSRLRTCFTFLDGTEDEHIIINFDSYIDLPRFDGELTGTTAYEKVLEHVLEDIAMKQKTCIHVTSANEATRREFISSVLHGVASCYDGEMKVCPEYELYGSHGKGPVDWVIRIGDTIIVVTEAKREDINQGVGQNAIQLQASSQRVDWVIIKLVTTGECNDNDNGNVEVFDRQIESQESFEASKTEDK